MNLILLSKSDFVDSKDKVSITGRRHKHILEVLKPSVGDELRVGLIGGLIGTGRVTTLDETSVAMKVVLDRDPPRPLPITLILSLPRPIVFRRLLGRITALGVKKILVIHSARVEKSYWKSPALIRESIDQELILGLEQAKDTIMPEVSLYPFFKQFTEDELPRITRDTRAFLAHPEAEAACPVFSNEPITLVVGPDGGFVPHEIETFKKAGCVPVRLGERTLRVETAVTAFISRFI